MDILSQLRGHPNGPARISRMCNLGYDRCVEFLAKLEANGLVLKETAWGHPLYRLTPDGYQTLEDYLKVQIKLSKDSF